MNFKLKLTCPIDLKQDHIQSVKMIKLAVRRITKTVIFPAACWEQCVSISTK